MFCFILKKLKYTIFDYYITKMFKTKNVFVAKPIIPKKESIKSKAINGYENIREKLDSAHGETTKTQDSDSKALKTKVSIGI